MQIRPVSRNLNGEAMAGISHGRQSVERCTIDTTESRSDGRKGIAARLQIRAGGLRLNHTCRHFVTGDKYSVG
jgi:hypothetical protein